MKLAKPFCYYVFFEQRGVVEVSEGEIQTTAMDHHGLVAAICQDLKIAERINNRLSLGTQRKVSPGIAAVAMIINGLGFTNRTLYLAHQFFASKPIERLRGVDLKAKDITDHALGCALDDIAEYGASKLFSKVAFGIALNNNLLDGINHIDTTSLLVHGAYTVDDDPQIIEVTHGFSKDHRPDLKQVVLSLVVNGPSSIPLWMDPFGNQIFHCEKDATKAFETIKKGYKLHKIACTVIPVSKHAGRGKPKKDVVKMLVGYKIETSFERDNLIVG